MRSEIAQEIQLDTIRYSQVWEDHRLLELGLEINPQDDVLSICSAGCNVLALLLCEPRSVVAIDMSRAQTALLELKLAGIQNLDHDDFIRLLGFRDSSERGRLYRQIRQDLSEAARNYFDTNMNLILQGIVHTGRLERYFQGFRVTHLAAHDIEEWISRLLRAPDLQTQRQVFKNLDTSAFQEAFISYFSRKELERHGRDPAQFSHVEVDDVGKFFWGRFAYACQNLPLLDNFYMESFLTGQSRDLSKAHPYLQPGNYQRLKKLVDRVEVVTGELESYLPKNPTGTFSKANLSDIFEYMSEELCVNVFRSLAHHIRPNGRIAYWNLLVPRCRPTEFAHRIRPEPELSQRLWRQDRSWFYRAFHVEVV